jgi:hypothetical protein
LSTVFPCDTEKLLIDFMLTDSKTVGLVFEEVFKNTASEEWRISSGYQAVIEFQISPFLDQ